MRGSPRSSPTGSPGCGPISFTLAANDYGLELLSPDRAPLDEAIEAGLFSPDSLLYDIPASLNAAELARRQFREIARVAGLLFQGFRRRQVGEAAPGVERAVLRRVRAIRSGEPAALPGPPRSARAPARAEPAGWPPAAITGGRMTVVEVERPTPLAFPLLVDRAREQLTSEKLADRVRRMVAPLEKAAEGIRFSRGPSRGFRSGG